MMHYYSHFTDENKNKTQKNETTYPMQITQPKLLLSLEAPGQVALDHVQAFSEIQTMDQKFSNK